MTSDCALEGNTNMHGQMIGRKGAETRQRMIDAHRGLLEQGAGARVTVAALTAAAGVSAPTFYLYFKDIDDVLLDLSREAADDTDEVLTILNEEWPPSELTARCTRFVEAFYRYWTRHREVLGLRNLQSDLGVPTFNAVRRKAAMPIVNAIASRILASHTEALPRADAVSRAIIIYAAIERLAARPATAQLQSDEIGEAELMRGEADILALLFTPPRLSG